MKRYLLGLLLITASVFAASSYTTNYNLLKPADGDTNWGSGLRTNMDTIDTQMYANSTGISNHIADTVDAHDASAISATSGTFCATEDTVQEFLDCLDDVFSTVIVGTLVTTDTVQTITAAKTWSALQTFSGVTISGVITTPLSTGVVHSDSGGVLSSSTIVNADVNAAAAIDYSKLNLSGSIVNADINSSAAIVDTKLATISTSGKVSNSATTAASANTASAIVARDGSGNFTAGTITAALSGNASTSTALAANPTDCGAGTKATAIDASGNLTCSAVSLTADVSGVTPIANGGTGQSTANPAFNALSPLTTKGDVITYSTVNARLGVGSNNQVLVADSAQTTGLKWASLPLASSALDITVGGAWESNYPFFLTTPLNVDINGSVSNYTGKWITTFIYGETSAVAGNRITSLTFNDLEGATGTINPTAVPAITTLSFPSLVVVGGSFAPSIMAALTTLSVPALKTVGVTFNPGNMALLTTLTMTNLTTIGQSFNANTMAALTTLSAPALVSVGVNFNPATMAALTTMSFPSLSLIGANFNPTTMGALTTLSFPALTKIGGTSTISSMASLTTISLPAMIDYGGTFTATTGLGAITTVTMGTIGTLKSARDITFSGQALTQASVDGILALIASLDGTSGTTSWGTGRTLTLNGGTNATPSAAGLVNKGIIQARGATVTTN